jgi:hypothetical protein
MVYGIQTAIPNSTYRLLEMSFGAQFLPRERRLQPDVHQLYHDLVENDIRSSLKPTDEHLHHLVQNLGRLYNTAPDHPTIVAITNGRKRNNRQSIFNERKNHTKKDEMIVQHRNNIITKESYPSLTSTLSTSSHIHGGKYNVSGVDNSYETPIMAKVSQSEFNCDTPKMWPEKTNYCFNSSLYQHHQWTTDNNAAKNPKAPLMSDRPCSKSISIHATSNSSSSAISALQRTLLECGRLRHADDFANTKVGDETCRAINYHRNKLKNHIKWLNADASCPTMKHHSPGCKVSSSIASTFSSGMFSP